MLKSKLEIESLFCESSIKSVHATWFKTKDSVGIYIYIYRSNLCNVNNILKLY